MVTLKIVALICVSFILGGALMGAACKGFLDNALNRKRKHQYGVSISVGKKTGQSKPGWRTRNDHYAEPMKADIPFISPKEMS